MCRGLNSNWFPVSRDGKINPSFVGDYILTKDGFPIKGGRASPMIGGLDPGTIWLQSPDQDPTESSLRS